MTIFTLGPYCSYERTVSQWKNAVFKFCPFLLPCLCPPSPSLQVVHQCGTSEWDAKLDALTTSEDALRAAVRVHLFTLLFEDCKLLCAKIVSGSKVISRMVELLSETQNILKSWKVSRSEREPWHKPYAATAVPETPKWMTPMLLFIDLHEKVVLGINRRAKLEKVQRIAEFTSCFLSHSHSVCLFILI